MATKQELKDYFNTLLEVEKHYYLEEEIISNLRKKLSGAFIPSVPSKPVEMKPNYKKYEKKPNTIESIAAVAGVGAVLGFVLCLILVGICAGIFSISIPVEAAWYFIIGGAIVAVLGCVISDANEDEQRNAKAKKEADDYNTSKMEEYNNKVALNRSAVANLNANKQIYEAQIKQLETMKSNTRQALNSLYAKNICYPKYRNFAAMSSIAEYLNSGRCDSLEGPNGAYNLYESELKHNLIITELKEIKNALHRIEKNQYLLYKAMSEANSTAYSIVSSIESNAKKIIDSNKQLSTDVNAKLKDIQTNSDLIRLNSELSQKELNYMNRMNYLNGNYGNHIFY